MVDDPMINWLMLECSNVRQTNGKSKQADLKVVLLFL
jgi:hypothetical protein